MARESWSIASVVLIGLAESLVDELRRIFREQGYEVHSGPLSPCAQALCLVEEVKADVVFCSAEHERCMPLLQALEREKPGLPVVAVSRLPEVFLLGLIRGVFEELGRGDEKPKNHPGERLSLLPHGIGRRLPANW